jgi:bacterioferritin
MKGNPQIIDVLNKSLEGELYAILQYILHSETAEDLGYQRLEEVFTGESRQEMGHAEMLIERIIFLEGTPQLKMNREVKWEKEFRKNLESQHRAELEGLEIYHNGVKLARETGDDGTRKLFEEIIKQEEEHVDWIEAQYDLLDQVGVENYLAKQIYK